MMHRAALAGLALLALALLPGCASLTGWTSLTGWAAPSPQTVRVPVAQPCLPADWQDPPQTTPLGAFSVMTHGEIAHIVASEWLEYARWRARWAPVLEACRE